MKVDDHKHLRRRRAREKHDNRRPLVECPRCGKFVRGLVQHQESGACERRR